MELEVADIEIVSAMLQRNALAGMGIMDFEMLDGFLCGVVVAPSPLSPSDWLPQVLGERPVGDPAQVEQAAAALMRLYNSVVLRLSVPAEKDAEPPLRIYAHQLNPDGTLIAKPGDAQWEKDLELAEAEGDVSPSPSVDEGDGDGAAEDDADPLEVGALWSVGFALATQLAEDDWINAAEQWELVDEIMQLSDLLLPALPEGEDDEDEALDENDALHAEPEALRAEVDEEADIEDDDLDETLSDPTAPLTTEERVIALGEMSEALHELYLLNLQRMQAKRTVRRDSPKIGRNDPCPCGSGRKYKFCHGAN